MVVVQHLEHLKRIIGEVEAAPEEGVLLIVEIEKIVPENR